MTSLSVPLKQPPRQTAARRLGVLEHSAPVTPGRRPGVRPPIPALVHPPGSPPSFWRQPPVYSPLPLRAILGAVRETYIDRTDSIPAGRALLRQVYHADVAYLLGSGTQALQLALRMAARMLGKPLRVALPAYGCYAIAAAAVGAGADIALYDVDPRTLGPDLDSLAATLAAGARIVVVAPLCGVPLRWTELSACASSFGAVLVEDAAQGHGAWLDGLPLGAIGSLSTLSFGRGKGWTGVQGGALLLRGSELPVAPTIRRASQTMGALAVGLRGVAQSAFGRARWYGLPAAIPWLGLGETRYRDPVAPQRMHAVAAGVMTRTFPLASREARQRRDVAADLLDHLPTDSRIRPIIPAAGVAGYLRLPLLLSRGMAGFGDPGRAERLGFAAGYPAILASLEPVRLRLFGPANRWPGAVDLTRRLVTLPTHSLLTLQDRDALLEALDRYRG